MRNHALIMKPQLTFYIQTCEYAKPRFDHETSANILFKHVNMRHHARQNFPLQKNLKLMQTLIKTPVFKDIVFWRLNERFMPNTEIEREIFFMFAVMLRTTIKFITLPTRLVPLD